MPSSSPDHGFRSALCREILRDAYRYRAGSAPDRPTPVRPGGGTTLRAWAAEVREIGRDALERVAGRAGFTRRHFDPEAAGPAMARILELSDGFDATAAALRDEPSRRALLDVLKLRVLGPFHTALALSPEEFRAKQAEVERDLRLQEATFEVSDPWFSPLSLFRVPAPGGAAITLHSHSAEVLSVYVLEQYGYRSGGASVGAAPGDIVLDIGGCWGDTALYFASQVGESGRVYTFEFDPESLQVLRANLALNPELAPRVEIVERALWNRSGEVLGFRQAGASTSLTSTPQTGDHEVETITVDDFLSERGLETLSFVKIDVEGAELAVLEGARNTLRRLHPKLAIAAYHRDDDLVRIPAEIRASEPSYGLYLKSSSPREDETVLFATVS